MYVFALQESPDELALHQLLSQDVENALWTLTEKERGVLRMRYGLDDGEEKTLEEIGVCFNVRRDPPLHNDDVQLGQND